MITRLISLGFCAVLLVGCAARAQTQNGSAVVEQDDQGIRQWFQQWIKATKEGDLQLAKSLIADDAVFLVPGAGRMDKASFAAAATASDPNIDFQLDSSIEEIRVLGDHAWVLTKMSLVMTDKRTTTRTTMAGHALSVLQRRGNSWIVVRDANTMVATPQ